MTKTKKTAIPGLVIAAVAVAVAIAVAVPAAADDRAPSSLHMREPSPRPRWNPIQLARRVAQRAPDAAPADPPPPSQPPAASAAPDAGLSTDERAALVEAEAKTEVISVTEAPIERRLVTGRAPMSVVTRSDLAASGHATLGDILQALPVQGNATNAQVNAGGDGTTRISLRGLGAPRTVVLLNGRRFVDGGAGADASVDINAIPVPVIERVEIFKDGASAMYGADAVGGVVNIVTRPQFDGVDLSVLTSSSQRSDGNEVDASAVTGWATRDKHTYMVVSAGYQRHEPVLAAAREFSAFQRSYDFATHTEARDLSLAGPGGRLDATSIGAGNIHPPGCSSNVCAPLGNGSFTNFVTPDDLYNEAAQDYLYTPSRRYNLFATAGNRLNDHAALFLELSYLNRDSSRQLSPAAFDAFVPISKDSLYNPFGADILDVRRRMTELGPRDYIDKVNTTRIVTGVNGTVPDELGPVAGWNYEVSYNWGNTSSQVGTTGQLSKLHLADSLGPSMMLNGQPICVRKPGDATTQIFYVLHRPPPLPPIATPCVPLDLLSPAGAIPLDQLKTVTFTDFGNGTDNLRTLLGTLGGRVAELPHRGEISLSLGGDYRYEVGESDPAQLASAGYSTDNTAEATSGRFHVYEGFGETAIVPFAGDDVVRRVELDVGARALHHDQFGTAVTYKLGGLVRTVGGVALRGTYATAFRAPTMFDLVGGQTQRMPAAEDPCDTKPPSAGDGTHTLAPMVQAECTAQGVPVGSRFTTSQQSSVVGGNPDLQAESAATATLGVVVEPPQFPGLALSADYWHIRIDDAIETLGVQTIFANCYDRGIQGYCDQIHRDPATHRINSVDAVLQNVGSTTTSGVDLALWYDARLAELGRIHTGLEAQYLIRYDLDTSMQVIHGVGYYDLGVYPHYKANLSSNWVHPSGLTGGFTLRYVGSYKECAGNDCNDPHNLAMESRDVDRYYKLDLYASYEIHTGVGRTTFQLGVNNVLDATPPVVYNAPAANSDATTYDFVGRMLFIRLSQLY